MLRHLPSIDEPPEILQGKTFQQLFKAAELANYSPMEQNAYAESLKHYRDLTNVVEPSRQEGLAEGQEVATKFILKLIEKQFGVDPKEVAATIRSSTVEDLDALNDVILEFSGVDELMAWLSARVT